MSNSMGWKFAEFFAGGGMARLGLGDQWDCAIANEWCNKKAATYRKNFAPARELIVSDVARLDAQDLPNSCLMAWASFPCQDLSLAGNGKGFSGARSSTFWPFMNLIKEKGSSGDKIPILVLENVVGAITSNNGKDLSAIQDALLEAGYVHGAIVLNARHFVPQSRPRLFIVAFDKNLSIPSSLVSGLPNDILHPTKLIPAMCRKTQDALFWRIPVPSVPVQPLISLLEDEPADVRWNTPEETRRLLSMMSDVNKEKVRLARKSGVRVVGTLYRRTRVDSQGIRVQRAEVRFDSVSGCLRTPAGGSSRQTLLIIHGNEIRSRLITSREAARIMGVPDTYELPRNYNEAYHLMGDGLVVPAVSWLAKYLLNPLAQSVTKQRAGSRAARVA